MDTSTFEFMDDVLQVFEASSEPIYTSDYQGITTSKIAKNAL
jgi:hypothetical protein